jgi:uncharacterized membrane protein YvbJ
MALIACQECGRQISSLATACPGCGAPPAATSSQAHQPTVETRTVISPNGEVDQKGAAKGWIYLAGVIAVLVVATIIVGSFEKPEQAAPTAEQVQARQDREERDRKARTIEFCEKRYKEMNADRQYTPEMLRFHSMTCRKMREDYRARWGRDP